MLSSHPGIYSPLEQRPTVLDLAVLADQGRLQRGLEG